MKNLFYLPQTISIAGLCLLFLLTSQPLPAQSHFDKIPCLTSEQRLELKSMTDLFEQYLTIRYQLTDAPTPQIYARFVAEMGDESVEPSLESMQFFVGVADVVRPLASYKNLYEHNDLLHSSQIYRCILDQLTDEELKAGIPMLHDLAYPLRLLGFTDIFQEETLEDPLYQTLLCLEVFYAGIASFDQVRKAQEMYELMPDLKSATYEPRPLKNMDVQLFYDVEDRLQLLLGRETHTSMDSLRTYLLEELRSMPVMLRFQAAAALAIPKYMKMKDVELVQEELKRLGQLKVFYLSQISDGSVNDFGNHGIYYKLPERDEERIHLFYQSRNIEPKEKESLSSILFQEEKAMGDENEKGLVFSTPPPPPPPPPSPYPAKYDPDAMGSIFGLQAVVIAISDENQISINDKPIDEQELYSTIANMLEESECLFVLRTGPEAQYGKYVLAIDAIYAALNGIRNKAAMQQYGSTFEELEFKNQQEIRSQIPLLLINEPIYYQEE